MSKYVDKMNLPQYRFYNHMVGEGEERKELVSDLLTAEMILERGSKKERSQALITLATKKKRLADFIYSQEEDRKRCLKDLTGRDMKQFRKRLDHYLDMLLMIPFFQGQSEKKRRPSRESLFAGRSVIFLTASSIVRTPRSLTYSRIIFGKEP